MKIDTKEKYNRIHAPLKPKSRIRKKIASKISETFKFTRLIPFIPDKDKNPSPFNISNFKRAFSLKDLLACFDMPTALGGQTYYRGFNIRGAHKHASECRMIAKRKRRRAYYKMCRAN